MTKVNLSKFRDRCYQLIERNYFRHIKVFHQILIIIAVMIAFFVAQYIFSFYLIDNSRQTTEQVFTTSTTAIIYVTNLNEKFLQIGNEYLKLLAGKSAFLSSAISEAEGAVSSLQNDHTLSQNKSGAIQRVVGHIQQMKQIAQEPVSADNYDRLTKVVDETKSDLNEIYSFYYNTNRTNIDRMNNFAEKSKMITLVILVLSILLSFLLGIMSATTISRPLNRIVQAVKTLARGDLTCRFEESGCPEVSIVAAELNLAITGLRGLVGGVFKQADLLLDSSHELKNASAETGASANQVALTMTDLVQASMEQADEVQNAVRVTNSVLEMIRKVSEDTSKMSLTAEKVTQSAKIGQEKAKAVTSEFNVLYSVSAEAATVIDELARTSAEITAITAAIETIAEQTTLLSLNAQIEAVRAGEYGKGFQVIAGETGKLAEQSRQSAKMISDLTNRVINQTNHAVTVMRNGSEKAKSGKALVSEAHIAFEEIFQALRGNIVEINSVAESTRRMAEKNHEVITIISAISDISVKNMALAEGISASTQQQSASVQEIAAQADNLTSVASNLHQSAGAFLVE